MESFVPVQSNPITDESNPPSNLSTTFYPNSAMSFIGAEEETPEKIAMLMSQVPSRLMTDATTITNIIPSSTLSKIPKGTTYGWLPETAGPMQELSDLITDEVVATHVITNNLGERFQVYEPVHINVPSEHHTVHYRPGEFERTSEAMIRLNGGIDPFNPPDLRTLEKADMPWANSALLSESELKEKREQGSRYLQALQTSMDQPTELPATWIREQTKLQMEAAQLQKEHEQRQRALQQQLATYIPKGQEQSSNRPLSQRQDIAHRIQSPIQDKSVVPVSNLNQTSSWASRHNLHGQTLDTRPIVAPTRSTDTKPQTKQWTHNQVATTGVSVPLIAQHGVKSNERPIRGQPNAQQLIASSTVQPVSQRPLHQFETARQTLPYAQHHATASHKSIYSGTHAQDETRVNQVPLPFRPLHQTVVTTGDQGLYREAGGLSQLPQAQWQPRVGDQFRPMLQPGTTRDFTPPSYRADVTSRTMHHNNVVFNRQTDQLDQEWRQSQHPSFERPGIATHSLQHRPSMDPSRMAAEQAHSQRYATEVQGVYSMPLQKQTTWADRTQENTIPFFLNSPRPRHTNNVFLPKIEKSMTHEQVLKDYGRQVYVTGQQALPQQQMDHRLLAPEAHNQPQMQQVQQHSNMATARADQNRHWSEKQAQTINALQGTSLTHDYPRQTADRRHHHEVAANMNLRPFDSNTVHNLWPRAQQSMSHRETMTVFPQAGMMASSQSFHQQHEATAGLLETRGPSHPPSRSDQYGNMPQQFDVSRSATPVNVQPTPVPFTTASASLLPSVAPGTSTDTSYNLLSSRLKAISHGGNIDHSSVTIAHNGFDAPARAETKRARVNPMFQ